jgi:hypothetical protein
MSSFWSWAGLLVSPPAENHTALSTSILCGLGNDCVSPMKSISTCRGLANERAQNTSGILNLQSDLFFKLSSQSIKRLFTSFDKAAR